jgi:hypothetical protein
MKKQTNELNGNFSKEEVQMDKNHEEMLENFGHKGNANQKPC